MNSDSQQKDSAAIYARLSTEDTDALAVSRQREDCMARAERDGLHVIAEFTESGASAFSGKRRPEFERLITAMAAGEFGVLLVWRLDRLARNLGDYARAFQAAEDGGVRIIGAADGVDTGTPSGEFMANVLFATARNESKTTAMRVARRAEQAAKAGLPHGGSRPFGYDNDRMAVHPVEGPLVVDAYERLIAGETVRSIAYDWQARGIVGTKSGRAMSPSALMRILRNPRNAGLRLHRRARGANGETIYPAKWEPLVSRDVWEQAQTRMQPSPSRPKRGRPAEHLLSGIAQCGRCGIRLWTSADGQGRTRYACPTGPGQPEACGRMSIVARHAEPEVRDRIVHALTSGQLADLLAEPASDTADAAGELAAAENRADEIASMFADGEMDRRQYVAARDRVAERVKRAQSVLDAASRVNVLAGLPSDPERLRDRWESRPVAWRRSLLLAAAETVVVGPPVKRGNKFDPGRIQITWRV